MLVVVFVGLALVALLTRQEGKKQGSKNVAESAEDVNVICEAGVRVILDGQFWGITQSRTNAISVKTSTDKTHRMILQKPGCIPQVFTATLRDWQEKQIVASSFKNLDLRPPPQFASPGDKLNRTDYGFGSLAVASDPKDCTVEFRSETIKIPKDRQGVILHRDVCEGAYPIAFHFKNQTLTTNVTFRPHHSVSLQADFVNSCILDLVEIRARYRESIKDLIKKLKQNDYADFSSLTEKQKDDVFSQLYEDKEWGQQNHKAICREFLAAQGHSFAKISIGTFCAIDLAEKQGWKDLTPLIANIYERPKDVWIYQRAFQYLRIEAGKPISTNIVASANIIQRAGAWNSKATDEQLLAAKESLLKESDKEAVLVYMIEIAGSQSGKGATDRGGKVAIDVLRGLDREAVVQRIRQLQKDSRNRMYRGEIEKVAKSLGVD